ncbi:TetR/AcrR family transcriptional regulator [Burkholderia gladioli]|uniref:TetR/AcrR family transcriptional regulator n=1 Tax=Burkholderia gladioli TaxID=28095 RepID=UPI001ABA7EC6|nr:TetR/AcrR family transcriptional regulator [Burkholderia gladioli]
MARVLDAASRMIEEVGLERTSIPALAEAAGVPRAAIYPFFPDKYALFAELAQMHLQRLAQAIEASGASRTRTWRTWVAAAIAASADYYNAHPVASALILVGSFAQSDRDAHAATNRSIGNLLRAEFGRLKQSPALPETPDVATIAVEIAYACQRHGYAREGHVSAAICEEASRAVCAYLACWETGTPM